MLGRERIRGCFNTFVQLGDNFLTISVMSWLTSFPTTNKLHEQGIELDWSTQKDYLKLQLYGNFYIFNISFSFKYLFSLKNKIGLMN